MDQKIKVLFVCADNSARSRMAEAFLKELGGSRFSVASAGLEPLEANPLAVEAMRLARVPLTATAAQASVFELFRGGAVFNYVIAVCDGVQGERCPIFPGPCTRLLWSFPDPIEYVGSDEMKLMQVIAVRDTIRTRVEDWVEELAEMHSR